MSWAESALAPWDPVAPLQRGITLIEASAGTGKTYNITSLVVRLVAEAGHRIDRICIVTFTRAATAELKDRVRARLVEAARALAGQEVPQDPIYASLWTEDEVQRGARARRLRDAVESFDQALISTIHGFCQRMLQIHAFESGAPFDLQLVTDTDLLLEELVDDHLSRTLYDASPEEILFRRDVAGMHRKELLRLARMAVSDPDTPVIPQIDADPRDWPRRVKAVAEEWEALAADFVSYVGEIHAAAKAGGLSPLKKGQRKFTGAVAQRWSTDVGAWLAGAPSLGSEPPDAGRFSLEGMRGQLVDPTVGLEHPALEQLAGLLAFADEVASGVRVSFIEEVRARFEQRKAELRIQTYQDLLRGLATRLAEGADPKGRAALARSIGATFDAVLIDEFQDTDHHQWTIFHTAFGAGAHHLYLIGDPKQAIYGFRGANIHVYGQATRQAGRRYTMVTNWRSDPSLLGALNHLLHQPYAFGAEASFDYIPVHAPDHRTSDGLRPRGGQGESPAPLLLRWFDPEQVPDADPNKPLAKGVLNELLAPRVAEDIVALLDEGLEIAEGEGWRGVRPADVAVLVRKGRQAVAIQEALAQVGVPAVLSGAASVLASDEARELEQWLAALLEGASGSAARVSASTRLFGWSSRALLAVEAAGEEASRRWDRWMEQLSSWRELWARYGFMRAFRRAMEERGVVERLLGLPDGERRVTNLNHVAELLHAVEIRQRLRPEALRAWLAQRRVADDLDAEEVELRLDRDEEAVRLLTVHKSKGLEFPICFVPFLWDGAMMGLKPGEPLLVPDPRRPERRLLDVGRPPAPGHLEIATRESREEDLRLAYVALTRARHQVVVYGSWARDYETSALGAILHGEGRDRLSAAEKRIRGDLQGVREDLRGWAQREPGGPPALRVVGAEPAQGLRWDEPAPVVPELAARRFQRGWLDPGWRRHSYSSVTRAAGHPELVEEGREGFDADAVAEPGPRVPEPGVAEVPLAGFPGGAAAGTLLHEVLEALDFDADAPSIQEEATPRLVSYGFDADRFGPVLGEGLSLALRTPLGHGLGSLHLADISRADRLDELRFDLPIRGGTAHREGPDPWAAARELVEALRSRTDGVLPSEWLGTLQRLQQVRLAGFLTGSIDLVFRADDRWYVVDYKSNRLDPRRTGRLVPSAYDLQGMTQEMARHDYFLQYHLYLVALHRFLTWRLPGYDYDKDVGGVYYLFLRGMVGPQTEQVGDGVHGAWFDRPPREVVERLDAALRGEGAHAVHDAAPITGGGGR